MGARDYDLDNFHHRGNYEPWRAYSYSKLANVHFTLELNDRLRAAGSDVRVMTADPGFAHTDLQSASVRNNPDESSNAFFERWVPRLGHSAAQGALGQLRAGTDPESEGGSLWRPRWVFRGAPVEGGIPARLRKPADLDKLWEISEKDVGIDFDVAAMVAAA